MREFVTNFQKKHGQQVPMPKIYGDEDSTDDEGPELADGTKAGRKKTTGSAQSTCSRQAYGYIQMKLQTTCHGFQSQNFPQNIKFYIRPTI